MNELKMVPVGNDDIGILYWLLGERTKEQSISHRAMPTKEEHANFVRSKPYSVWNMIIVDSLAIGSIYLTHQNEIGVMLFNEFQGKGYGKRAVEAFMQMHPRKRFLANINPANLRSIGMFEGLGFKHIQNTYEFLPEEQQND